MNFLRPFSPPGKPPVRPSSPFSKVSSLVLKGDEGAEQEGVGWDWELGDGSCWIALLSSLWRLASPLQRPLPPMISESWNLAAAAKMVLGSG